MSTFKVRRQRPVKGGRERLYAGLIKEIDQRLEEIAHRFRVTKSFAAAVALADALGIEEQERFLPTPRSGKVVPITTVVKRKQIS